MKFRLLLLLNLCAVAGFGQYVWDYSKNPVVSDSTRWSSNGSPAYGSYGVNFSGSGGSLISTPAISAENPATGLLIPGSSSSDYEVTSTLALNSGGGTYIHFFRASGGAVQAGSGSYFSIELMIPSGFTSPGTATVNINQCVSGVITTLASASITATNGMAFRTVIHGTSVNIFVNNVVALLTAAPLTTGNPGIGGYGIPAGSGFQSIELGHQDTIAPPQISLTSIASSVFPTSVSLKWQGVLDDPTGIGLYYYAVRRNGASFGRSLTPDFADPTALPATTYTYAVRAIDFHGNLGSFSTITVTTPAAGAVDPRRTGIYTTGSYWGGGGEQIDTLSGNLNFSLPLLTAQGRTGWTVPVGLVYNSQNWRQDGGANWMLGSDVGYGFGWQMLIGSITPYMQGQSLAIDHYVYTDSTGAQYLLTVNNSGVWSGTNGVYVWFDSNADILHFRDGSFWVMGCTSGGTEADAGTRYPTVIEDVSGNQVLVNYQNGLGVSAADSSARILGIEDGRYAGSKSYYFNFNSDTPVPHLSSIVDMIGTGAGHTFTYAENVALEPPFGTDPDYAGLTTTQLASMSVSGANPYQFTYDSAGASELLQATFPWGGHLRWTYATDPYSASRDLRAVSGRYLAADSAGATEWSYGISRDNASASGEIVHGTMTLSDASGVGAKTWNFYNTSSSPAWEIGLASEFVQSASSGGTVLQDDLYTWSQDPAGNPYIAAKWSEIGQGTANSQKAYSTQTLDQYGNVTQSVVYPYNSMTPLKTYNNLYLNATTSVGAYGYHTFSTASYPLNYIFNKLVNTTVTPAGGSPISLVLNYYDFNSCGIYSSWPQPAPCPGWTAPTSSPTTEIDPSPPIPLGERAYLTSSSTPQRTTSVDSWTYGAVGAVSGTDGTAITMSADASTNYAAPLSISSQSYNTAMAYNSWLGVTQSTGANGEQMSMTYDSYGRPTSGTSPYQSPYCYCGPTVSYAYGTSAPFTQTKAGPDGKTVTTLDGLGRAIQTDRGDTTSMHSSAATVYAPCACSPLGKIQKTSQPYSYGSSASAWTTYTYDGLGRPLTVQQPDGASTTTYSYSGNVATVSDPAGNSKQFTTDVSGNLVTVVEPDPANPPSGTLTATYTYDWMNHVNGVSMVRAGTTQTRSFVYDNAGHLTSATNPENGTVSYTYGSNNAVQMKTDAKGQQTVYTYDSLNRLTMTQYYPTGTANPEDGCERVAYSYDTNPSWPGVTINGYGRLTVVSYGAPATCAPGTFYSAGPAMSEMYAYHPAGAVTKKVLNMYEYPSYGSLEVDYSYDNAGRTASTTYPMAAPFSGTAIGAVTLNYGYDSMGRPNSLTDSSGVSGAAWLGSGPVNWVQNVQYDYAGRLNSMQYISGVYGPSLTQRTMGYNVNGQLTSLDWATNSYGYGFGAAIGINYVYSATQNNGQITQAVDSLSGETIAYAYDALKRLTSAASTPTSGSSTAPWTQTFQYDGFGNLTAKVLNGTSTPISVIAANNRLSSASYDANGNMTSGSGATITYDEANRISSAAETSGGIAYYAYTADNKRYYSYTYGGNPYVTFYGAKGEKLGVYGFVNYYPYAYPVSTNIWFAGKPIVESNQPAYLDRLGTNRVAETGYVYDDNPPARFYPYGDEITSTANDHEKFATYTRDSYTGFDYADQRYYASSYGRFLTPDPTGANAADTSDSRTWNMYTFVGGDPVGNSDPAGTNWLTDLWNSWFGNGCSPGVLACVTGYATPDPTPIPVTSNVPYLFSLVQSEGGGDSGGGGGGGGDSAAPAVPPSQPTCVTPTFAQRAVATGLSFLSQRTGVTLGYGTGGSIGAGRAPIAVNYSLSMQFVAAPDGTIGKQFSYTPNSASYFSAGTTGAGGLFGLQFSGSNARTIGDLAGGGVDIGGMIADELGFGGDVNLGSSGGRTIAQGTVTLGFGFGGKGSAGVLTQTVIKPFCK